MGEPARRETIYPPGRDPADPISEMRVAVARMEVALDRLRDDPDPWGLPRFAKAR